MGTNRSEIIRQALGRLDLYIDAYLTPAVLSLRPWALPAGEHGERVSVRLTSEQRRSAEALAERLDQVGIGAAVRLALYIAAGEAASFVIHEDV
jgi:hypothetical protein